MDLLFIFDIVKLNTVKPPMGSNPFCQQYMALANVNVYSFYCMYFFQSFYISFPYEF